MLRKLLFLGAHDGIGISNTLLLEIKHFWTGLLVEPNPIAFKFMTTRNRNSWLFNHCLSTSNATETVLFELNDVYGGIQPEPSELTNLVEMVCFPLFSILQAIGQHHVDYFSLDVEGAELPILRAIPWNKINVNVISIETNSIGEVFPGSMHELRTLMFKNGFKLYQKTSIDELYVKKSFLFPAK